MPFSLTKLQRAWPQGKDIRLCNAYILHSNESNSLAFEIANKMILDEIFSAKRIVLQNIDYLHFKKYISMSPQGKSICIAKTTLQAALLLQN